jgi:hypothetical protein
MSSTSNVQNLLVNVFRPTYRYDTNTGFTPALVMSNVDEIITTRLTTSSFTVTDSNVNTYIGSNAGLNASNTAQNTGLGFEAMAGAISAVSNVAIGAFNFSAVRNAANNVGIGVNTRLASGNKNILIGPNLTIGDGSGNIIIGADISQGNLTNRLQIGTLLYGDLSSGFVGINKTDPSGALDISGIVIFRNKVGFQTDSPDYSLDVAGSIYVSDRFIGGDGTAVDPLYTFKNSSNTGMYVPPSATYGSGAFAISINSNPAAVFMSNKVQFFQNLDVSGTFSASNLNLGGFSVSNGSAAAPTITFLESQGTGVFLVDSCGLAFTTAGVRKMVLLSNGDLSAGRILASDISYSGRIFGSDPTSCNVIGGVTLSNGNVILTGVATNTNLLVPGWLRDTNPATSLDISGGNISNSGTTRSSNFRASNGTAGTPSYSFTNDASIGFYRAASTEMRYATQGIDRIFFTSNRVGILDSPNCTFDVSGVIRGSGGVASGANGYFRDTFNPTNLDISGGNISNSGTTRSATFLGTNASTSNQIGGVTFSNSDLSMSATGRILAPILRNALTPSTLDISGGNISNSGTHLASNFIGTASASNQIGGVTFSNFDLCMSTTGRILSVATTSNQIGGVTFSNSDLSMSATGRILAPILRNALTPSTYDISGGNISNSGATRSSNFRGSNGSVSVPTYSFTSDPSTGLHLVNTSYLAFDTSGVQRMCISGNLVGIGTAAPAARLHIYDATASTLALQAGTIKSGGSNVIEFQGTDTGTIVPLSRIVGIDAGAGASPYRGDLAFITSPTANTYVERMRIRYDGRVGITTSNPGYQLDVCGTIAATTSVSAGGRILMAAQDYGTLPNASAETTVGDIKLTAGGGYNAAIRGVYPVNTFSDALDLRFATTVTGSSATADRMTIKPFTGSVGINTTAPATNLILDVSGRMRILCDGSTSLTSFGLNNGADTLILQHSGNYANMGDTGKSASILFANASCNYPQARIASEMLGVIPAVFSSTLLFQTGTAGAALVERMRIHSNGFVGINTNNPGYQLDICGDLRISGTGYRPGGGSWITTSDRRVKQDIQRADVSLCYDIIKRLPLQRFSWDVSHLPDLKDKRVVGWIAQDVEQVFPRAVEARPDYGFEDLKYLDVDQLYKTMYGAVEKLIADKEALEVKVSTQETLLQTILADKEALETNMSNVLTRLTALEASQQSSGSTQQTLPTPPPPEEPQESAQEPLPQSSSEYAPAPAETEA